MELSTQEGYALWSETYDEGTNALIVVEGQSVLDAVRQSGLDLVRVEDIPLRAAAAYLRKDGIAEELLAQHGDMGFCLVVLGQLPSA
jgi:hypothetical protein